MTKPEWKKMALAPGFKVAIVMPQASRGHRCYIGEVECVDDHGVRITLVDFIGGQFDGADLFVPWASIGFIQVATPDHDLGECMKDFTRLQFQVNRTDAQIDEYEASLKG